MTKETIDKILDALKAGHATANEADKTKIAMAMAKLESIELTEAKREERKANVVEHLKIMAVLPVSLPLAAWTFGSGMVRCAGMWAIEKALIATKGHAYHAKWKRGEA